MSWGSKYLKYAALALVGVGAATGLYVLKQRAREQERLEAEAEAKKAAAGSSLKKGFLDAGQAGDGDRQRPASPAQGGPAAAPSDVPMHPDAARARKRGNDAMKQKKPKEAIVHYSEALMYEPSGPNAVVYLKNRAQAYLSVQEFDLCLADCKRALDMSGNKEEMDSKAAYRAGEAYFGLELFSLAVPNYEAALAAVDEADKNRATIAGKLAEAQRRAAEQSPEAFEQVYKRVLGKRDELIQMFLGKAETLGSNGKFTSASAQCLYTALALALLKGHNALLTATVFGGLGIYFFGDSRLEDAETHFMAQLHVLDSMKTPDTYEAYRAAMAAAGHEHSSLASMEAFHENRGQELAMRQVAHHYLALLRLQREDAIGAAALLRKSIECAVESHEQQRQYSAMLLVHLSDEGVANAASPEESAFWAAQKEFLAALPGIDVAAFSQLLAQQKAMQAQFGGGSSN